MTSPRLVLHGENTAEKAWCEDPLSLRLTPTPRENYRCPVSTPANFVQRHARIRRTKTLQDIYSQSPTIGSRSQRSVKAPGGRLSRNTTLAAKSWTPKVSSGLSYYFVDKRGDRQEAKQTNSGWLKALCAQPVDEILNKYRRKSDFRRTRVVWSKTFTTPGEKSLLSAWDNSVVGRRSQKPRSALVGGARTRNNNVLELRPTKSEPPLSRAQFHDLSPDRDSNNTPRAPSERNADDIATSSPSQMMVKQHRIKGILLEEQSPREGSRVKFYTTQYFLPKDGPKRHPQARLATGPEQLPRLSSGHKVATMLYNTHYYSSTEVDQSSEPTLKQPSSPPIPEDNVTGHDDAMS